MKRIAFTLMIVALLAATGCGKPRAKEISSLARKEAESLASEAQFAVSVRDVARAEAALAKAAALCPDTGDYWLELGRCRVKLGNRGGAKDAYKSALAAYEDDAAREGANRGPAIARQVYTLALLGRVDEARARLAKGVKELPGDRDLKDFADTKQLDALLASPAFKESAL